MNDKEKKAIILHDILIPSISMLYNEDFSNIRFGASERNISARLAHHMENMMQKTVLPCSNAIMQTLSITEWVMEI